MNFILHFSKLILALFSLTFIACQSNPDFEALRSEILELHKKTIDARWNKDADFFIKDLADDFLSVQNGEIQRPQKVEIKTKMSDYLNHATFTEYRDLQEPIIGFSKDGSVAWSIVQVKVAGKRTMDDGTERNLDFTCAWITLYERQGDKWIRLGEVS
ncbi:MAG TPA: hypothetical protein VGD14_12140, partial [bacterium]